MGYIQTPGVSTVMSVLNLFYEVLMVASSGVWVGVDKGMSSGDVGL